MYEFIPLKKVGDFIFGTKIDDYLSDDFQMVSNNDKTGWDSYFYKDSGLTIYTDNKVIVSIACHKQCLFGSENIIGMNLGMFTKNYNHFPNLDLTDTIFLSDDDDKPHIVYEFEELGMQIWVKEGVIVTAICDGDD